MKPAEFHHVVIYQRLLSLASVQTLLFVFMFLGETSCFFYFSDKNLLNYKFSFNFEESLKTQFNVAKLELNLT